MYYYLTWTLNKDQYTVESEIWRTMKGVAALLEVLEIPYTIRCEPIPSALPGEIPQ